MYVLMYLLCTDVTDVIKDDNLSLCLVPLIFCLLVLQTDTELQNNMITILSQYVRDRENINNDR